MGQRVVLRGSCADSHVRVQCRAMEVSAWIAEHWFDLLQTVGIIGGLLLTAYTLRKDEKARKISNLIAINAQYQRIWNEFYACPMLRRVLRTDVDLGKEPISDDELLFVKMLLFHVDTVRRATDAGLFVEIQKIQKDIQDFFSFPIPQAIWEKLKPFQNEDFVEFIESSLRPEISDLQQTPGIEFSIR